MAAKGEQIPAPAPIAAPSDAPDPRADGRATSKSTSEAEAGGRSASDDVLQGEDPQGGSPSALAPPQEDGDAKEEEEAGEGREEQGGEADDAGGAGHGGDGGGVGGAKRAERKGALFLPGAKRRKACPGALEKLPAEESVGGGDGAAPAGRGGVAGGGESPPLFSFSFDTRGFAAPPIETTPKFGSFNFAALTSAGSGAETLAAAAGDGEEVRGQDAEGGAP